MNLATLATEVAARNCPVRVVLIRAGKFGSMFLSQVPTIAGINKSYTGFAFLRSESKKWKIASITIAPPAMVK